MAESDRRLSLEIPWTTLLKVILAVALVAVLVRIWYILTLILIAIIVAVGLQPAVAWLERRGSPRWAASAVVVFLLVAGIVVFFAVTWHPSTDRPRISASICKASNNRSPSASLLLWRWSFSDRLA
jgi:predicted PurR-regulated permease PerM